MEDSPRYKTGETVVVFLQRVGGDDFYTTVGMSQGRYAIEEGRIEGNGLPVVEFTRRIEALVHGASTPSR